MRVNRNVRLLWRRVIGQLGTLLLSIIMGLIVWLIAINQENPLVTDFYPDPVPLQVRNLAPNLAFLRAVDNERVRVELQGPRLAWERLKPSDINATVDLSNLGAGEHTAPVVITVNDPEMKSKGSQPAVLTVNLDTVITQTVPVTVEIMDSPAYGYNPLPAIVDPPTVEISGPTTRMEHVDAVRSQVYLRGAQDQVERIQTVEPVDDKKQVVEQVAVTPNVVKVTVPIAAWPGRKQVGVRVDLEGQPANGYRLGPVKVDPTNVVLIGDSELLNSVGVVETEPVSVEGATADIRARLKLLLPPNVTAFEGEMVDVIIGIVPVEDSSRITLRPILRGLGPGLVASVALDTVDVIMSGPKSILDALEPDDVFVILDLSNRLAGVHVLTPQVVIPEGIRLEGVLPETVEVVITNVAAPPITTTAPATVSATITAPVSVTTTPSPAAPAARPQATPSDTATPAISATPTTTKPPPATVSATAAARPTRPIPRPTPPTLAALTPSTSPSAR